MYLVLQSIGKEIANKYQIQRENGIEIYYAGNYNYMRPSYKQDYDDFYKSINFNSQRHQYFIKTDISNFFSNINVDLLIRKTDFVCNKETINFTQTQLMIFKEFLLYCGGGRFPLVENSVASSFLVTIVYLDEIDIRINNFIKRNLSEIFCSYKIIRYVDDMYILISSDKDEIDIHSAYNKIRNEYSSILKEYSLSLNTKKCCDKEMNELNGELKKSLYDEYFRGERTKIEELFPGALNDFLKALYKSISDDLLDVERYNELVERFF